MREAEVAAREKLLQARSEFEKVSRKQRAELEAQERRLTQKGDSLDKRTEELSGATRSSRSSTVRSPGARRTLEKREGELERMIDGGAHQARADRRPDRPAGQARS